MTRIWNYKRSREGFSLLKVSLVCRGAKSVVDWSVVGRRNPEKKITLFNLIAAIREQIF